MDSFDDLLKNKAHNEKWEIPERLDDNINNILNNLPNNKVHKKTPLGIFIAAAIFVLTTTTVFAAGPSNIKNAIKTAISYFSINADSKYNTEKENFQSFNNAIGITSEDKGIKFTVDNVAVDDNFLNIFYTVESSKPIPKNQEKYFSALFTSPLLYYKIDGKNANIINNNDSEAYFQSDYILKGMNRLNISNMTVSNNFKLDVFTDKIFNTSGNWNISATIDKGLAEKNTKTVTPKQKASITIDNQTHNISIDKVSISPFASQILISEKVPNGKSFFGLFALLDDKGNSLDVLNTDHTVKGLGKTTNAFEFVKANKDMKYITLVPIKTYADNAPKPLSDPIADISKFPITLKTAKTGSIVVDDLAITKNLIKVTYHKEGITLFDPAFVFYDKSGKKIELGDGDQVTSVDRVNGEYTQTTSLFKDSMDFSKVAKISTFADEKYELLYNQQIKINLQ